MCLGTTFDKFNFRKRIYFLYQINQTLIHKIKTMKKINFLFAILIMAGMTFLTSCGTDTAALGPNMDLKGGSGYTSSDVTVPVGSEIKVGVTAQQGDAKLVNIKITATANNVPVTLLDSTFSSDSFNKDYFITAPSEVGTVRISVVMKDKDGLTDDAAFNITTTAVAAEITTYSGKILGSYDNTAYGSSFASSNGTVYTLAEAKANAAKIDWMYYYGVTNKATLAAPSDASVTEVFTSSNGPATWSVRNATKFGKVTLSGTLTWDGITNDAQIITLAAGLTSTKAAILAVGDFIAFETVLGKKGLIKIENITLSGAGTITYSVKVQK